MKTLLCAYDGTVFGEGADEEEAFNDAAENAYHGDDLLQECTPEWLCEQISRGVLRFLEEVDSDV